MKNILQIYSPIGTLRLEEDKDGICGLYMLGNTPKEQFQWSTSLLWEAKTQLDEYFAGKRKEFDLPLAPKGTEFQIRTWAALRTIPYGETWSYKQLAQAAGSPKGYRAVGMANNRNPISIIVPCHRVIGSDGSLVGFGGGLDAKRFLLEMEKKH